MVYLKEIFVAAVVVLIFGTVLLDTVEAANTKIAYKKTITGKSQVLKEKQWPKTDEKQLAADNANATTSAIDSTRTTTTALVPTKANASASSQTLLDSIEESQIDENKSEMEQLESTPIETDEDAESELSAEYSTAEPEIEEVAVVAETAVTPLKTTETTPRNNNLPVPCTCGVFLKSQFKHGSNMQPHGKPVISNEQDRIYPCNAIGQKQCQTKCLEQMVQHLPNSANILCATVDRDIRKERAYLFVKNCRNHWVNTNLAAGREYCCKGGKSYQCPLI